MKLIGETRMKSGVGKSASMKDESSWIVINDALTVRERHRRTVRGE